jgi:hypothetical protein
LSENATQNHWLVILTVLLLVGMVVAGPILMAQVGPDAHHIELSLPAPINGSNTLAITSLQAIGGLAALVIGGVVVMGLVLSFLFSRAEQGTVVAKTSEPFQAGQASLKKKAADRLSQMREGRTTSGIPSHETPRWAAFSTSAIVILFTIFLGMLLNATLIPHSEYTVDGRTASSITAILVGLFFISLFIMVVRSQLIRAKTAETPVSWDSVWVVATGLLVVGAGISLLLYYSGSPEVERTVNSAVPVVGGMVLTALLVLAWRIHPQKLNNIDQTDNGPIPWDFIWVFLTGLIVVGLGMAFVIYLNTPG